MPDDVLARSHEQAARTRHPGGRPAFVPTPQQRELVELARANGVPIATIAKIVKVPLRTVNRHFRAELALGKERVAVALGAVVLRAAMGGDWRAAMAWLGRHGGPEWRNIEGRLHAGMPGGAPIPVTGTGKVVIVELPPNGRTDVSPDEIEAEDNAGEG